MELDEEEDIEVKVGNVEPSTISSKYSIGTAGRNVIIKIVRTNNAWRVRIVAKLVHGNQRRAVPIFEDRPRRIGFQRKKRKCPYAEWLKRPSILNSVKYL